MSITFDLVARPKQGVTPPTSAHLAGIETVAQGVKLIFFSDSHLAPKFFKVVANSKKSWSPFLKSNKTFFYAVSVLDRPSKIKLGKDL